MKRIAVFLVLGTLAACASTPKEPPAVVASTIVEQIDAGHSDAARSSFLTAARSARYRDAIYPVIFEAARQRYREGKFLRSAALLRFLGDQYPSATAVREGLLYALFLERTREPSPDPESLGEIDDLLQEVMSDTGDAPASMHLVATQEAIDRGALEQARASFERFQAAWDGEPPELLEYIQELDRFLTYPPSHKEHAGHEKDTP